MGRNDALIVCANTRTFPGHPASDAKLHQTTYAGSFPTRAANNSLAGQLGWYTGGVGRLFAQHLVPFVKKYGKLCWCSRRFTTQQTSWLIHAKSHKRRRFDIDA